MADVVRLSTCLWFDREAEVAARFYVSVFGGEMSGGADYPESDFAAHEGREGTPMVVGFRIAGIDFVALNGGPQFTHSPAISFQVHCDTQAEIDHFWEALRQGGDPAAQQCGWLKDRFGVSWQVVPSAMSRWMSGGDAARAERVMKTMLPMTKLDIAALEAAAAG
jgi:predicted 3-demethylubiquinone-9 3-methyltransferase (glyoxalase superfamily)